MKTDSNKDFFYLLSKHYELVRALCMNPRHFESKSDAIGFIADNSEENLQANALFDRFVKCGVLVQNYSFWVVPSYITLFIRKREGINSFTSSETVRGFLRDLENGKRELTHLTSGQIQMGSREIIDILQTVEDSFCQISAASQNNCSKISEEVEEFQLNQDVEFSDSKIRHFHRLYDKYIEPMLGIIVDPNGELGELSRELVKLCETVSFQFAHFEYIAEYSNNLKRRVRTTTRQIADKVRQAKNELEVIFEVYAKHSRIMKGIGTVWEVIADDEAFEQFARRDLLGSDSSLKSYQPNTASYRHYLEDILFADEHVIARPTIAAGTVSKRTGSDVVAFSDIIDALRADGQVVDVMVWLFNNYTGQTLSYYIQTLFDLEKRIKLTVCDDICDYRSENNLSFELNRREYNG